MTTRSPSSPPTTAATADRLRLSVTRLSRRLRRESGSGLTPSQSAMLATVERHGPLSLGTLAEREGVAPPTVTRMVNRLADDGLVRREADPADGRSIRVSITRPGRALLAASRRRKSAWLAARIDALGDRERLLVESALDVLDRLAEDAP